ncbi:MAG: CRISPR-associated endonuclease Cas2 [Leptotrichiaceae bacterium]|nr:CRISPR-associated endonuclease Cas2 [Leptotrichiaceae bacterium]
MRYLLSYDISKNQKRYRVAKLFEEFGCWRIQKSVYYFEGSESKLELLRQNLIGFFRNESLVIVPVEQRMLKNIVYIGARVGERARKELIFI